jgi:isopenicillin N synthase-like dioxygenase
LGRGGLGIVLVDGLEDWFTVERAELLASARAFAGLDQAAKAKYEMPEVDYAIGWSRGRERFRGKIDIYKGSFYANPVFDDPANGDETKVAAYPHTMTSNIWPEADEMGGANMEQAFKLVGRYVHSLGVDLAWHCDRYVEHVRKAMHGFPVHFSTLHDFLKTSRGQKGRLLHYFPTPSDSSCPPDDPLWCGFHNDHGTITGLVAGEYYNTQTGTVLDESPDPEAGLHVCPLGWSEPVSVRIPANSLGFQIGETAQIMSGGILRAGPHAVIAPRRSNGESVCRSTMALFLQPNPEDVLHVPAWDSEGAEAFQTSLLVPPLRGRFCDGDSFAQFCSKTIQAYVVP